MFLEEGGGRDQAVDAAPADVDAAPLDRCVGGAVLLGAWSLFLQLQGFKALPAATGFRMCCGRRTGSKDTMLLMPGGLRW